MNAISFILVLLFSTSAFAGPPVIWGPNKANILPASLCFADATCMTTAASTTAPGGSTTQVQFNSSSAFAGSANMTWDNTNKQLIIGNYGVSGYSPGLVIFGDGSVNPQLRLSTASNNAYYWDIGRENASTGDFIINNANGGSSTEHFRIAVSGKVTLIDLLHLPVQGSGVTPTCNTAGDLAITNGLILCVCSGSAWKKVSDGTTACTF